MPASAMGVMVSMACSAEVVQGAAADLERGAAGFHALEIEDVVDEADEAVRVGDGDAEEIQGLGVDVTDDAGGEKAKGAADAGQGGAELVRDGGDELVLEGVELRALGELHLVVMLLLAGLRQLRGELAGGTLRSKKGDQENRAGTKQRKETKDR